MNFGGLDHILFVLTSEDLADCRQKRVFIAVHGISVGELVIQKEECWTDGSLATYQKEKELSDESNP